jgi:hypothetical protein
VHCHFRTWPSRYALLTCLLLLAPVGASANNLPLITRTIPDHRLWLSLGWESTWAVGLGHARGLRGLLGGRDAQLEVSALLPLVLLPRFEAGRLSVGMSTLLRAEGRFDINVGANTGLALANDPTGRKLAMLAGFVARPGYYGERGSVALDLGWQGALATYFWHSDLVRDTFEERYPEGTDVPGATRGPSNGWSLLTASRLRAGAVGGYRLSDSVALFGGGGFEYTPNELGLISAPMLGRLPFYIHLGGDYRW